MDEAKNGDAKAQLHRSGRKEGGSNGKLMKSVKQTTAKDISALLQIKVVVYVVAVSRNSAGEVWHVCEGRRYHGSAVVLLSNAGNACQMEICCIFPRTPMARSNTLDVSENFA